MTLKSIDFNYSYDSDFDDILNDFYIPILSNAISYKRLAGFFSSTILAVSAKAISELISNNGHMRLICSARLSKSDIEIIKEAYETPEKIIENKFIEDLDNLQDEFIKDHVRALGWMIANEKLDIKIAIVFDENKYPLDEKIIEKKGIFHQKVGIVEDSEGDKISFSGSANESASGWLDNIEEFKVFRSWENHEMEYLNSDEKRFEKFWHGMAKRTKVIDVPQAVKRELIKIAPENIEELNLKKWLKNKKNTYKNLVELYDHQIKAVEKWLNNDKKGIFEMATGTGKTFTALGCLQNLLENDEKFITVIACPYDHLVKQWEDDIKDFGITIDTIIADSTNPKWKNNLADYLLDIKIGIKNRLIVLTTHTTLSSSTFIQIITMSANKLFLIADEVHGLGAGKRQNGLIEDYCYKLGLSATPKRWFDLEGTNKLFDYFGGTVFEFTLSDAINTINPATGLTYLTPYEYKPYFVELNDSELEEYEQITQKIVNVYHNANKEKKEELISLLSFKRQGIIKNAENKYIAFNDILNQLSSVEYCLIYCLPEQMEHVQNILNHKGIIQHKFTLKEGTKAERKYGGISERKFLLKKFADGTYNALIAIKCLDEGVDIPPARTAIILASSGNPREYIQRAGRVLRRYPGKEKSIIYDIIVVPTLSNIINPEFLDIERKIIKKELMRYKEFTNNATNKLECLNAIEQIELKYKIFIPAGELYDWKC